MDKIKNIFEIHYSKLCHFADRFVNNIDIAEDIVQDAFLTLWEDSHNEKDSKHTLNFLYKIIRNKSLNHLRRTNVENKYTSEKINELETEHIFMGHMIEEEALQIIQQTQDSLKNKCKEVFVLAMQEKSNKEISETLNISVNTVKTHKSTAYKTIKQKIGKVIYLIISFTHKHQDYQRLT